MASSPSTLSWYALGAIYRAQQEEFDQWAQIVQTEGGLACPRDGEPLQSAPPTRAGSGVTKFCRFCRWSAPDDVVPLQRGVKMGRNG
jgi:hypothetical protein